MTDTELQRLRDSYDNVYIDNVGESVEKFEEKPRDTAEYKSSYCEMLAELYDRESDTNEDEAKEYARHEKEDWLEIYKSNKRISDSLVAKIIACDDFICDNDIFS